VTRGSDQKAKRAILVQLRSEETRLKDFVFRRKVLVPCMRLSRRPLGDDRSMTRVHSLEAKLSYEALFEVQLRLGLSLRK
jgi:hypothetical protein